MRGSSCCLVSWFPAHPRLRNVTSDSVEARIEEWEYLNDAHYNENCGQFVIEEGYRYVEDVNYEKLMEAGTTLVDETWYSIDLTADFDEIPVILTQPQTYKDSSPIVTRVRNVGTGGFDVRLQEEEAADDNHLYETIGYLAIDQSVGKLDSTKYEAGLTDDTVTHDWHTIYFQNTYDNPVFLADMQTMDGSNTCGLRYRNLSSNLVEVMVEEERSSDSETGHTSEQVGYLVLEG